MPDDNTTPTNQAQTVEPDANQPTTTAGEMSQRLNDIVAKVIEKIEGADSILVALSQNPSVDEMAAAIGLTMLLDNIGKHATAIYSGATPNALEFLEPDKTFEPNTNSLQDFIIALDKEKADHLRYKIEGDFVKVYITPYKTTLDTEDLEYSHGDFNVDLVISLDVESGEDLDSALSEYGRIMHDATAINITTNAPGRFAEVEWSDPEASSVCEMIVNLIRAMGEKVPPLEKDVATALLTGIVAGTDRFSNERTSSTTMEIAASLMDAGADQQLVSTNIMKEGAKEPEPESTPVVETGMVVEPLVNGEENGGLSVEHPEENKMVAEPEIEKQDFNQQIQPVVPVEAPVTPPELPTIPEMAAGAVTGVAAAVATAVPEVPALPEVPAVDTPTVVTNEIPAVPDVVPVAPEVPVTPEMPVTETPAVEAPTVPEVPTESVAEEIPVTIGTPADIATDTVPVEPPTMPEASVNPEAPAATDASLTPLSPSEDLQPAAVSVPAAVHDLSAVPEVAPVTPDYAEVKPAEDDGAIDYGKLMDEALAEPLPIELEQQAAAQAAEMAAASAEGRAVPIVSPPEVEPNPAVEAAPAVQAPEPVMQPQPVVVPEPVAAPEPVAPVQPMVMPGVDILPPPPMPPVDMNIPMPDIMPGAAIDPNAAQMPQPQPEMPIAQQQPAAPTQPDPGAFQIPGM